MGKEAALVSLKIQQNFKDGSSRDQSWQDSCKNVIRISSAAETSTSERHHEETVATQTKFHSEIIALVDVIRQHGHPFQLECSSMVTLHSQGDHIEVGECGPGTIQCVPVEYVTRTNLTIHHHEEENCMEKYAELVFIQITNKGFQSRSSWIFCEMTMLVPA